jgi:hypothetical protein
MMEWKWIGHFGKAFLALKAFERAAYMDWVGLDWTFAVWVGGFVGTMGLSLPGSLPAASYVQASCCRLGFRSMSKGTIETNLNGTLLREQS